MSTRSESALSCFSGGFNCAQSVFTVFCEELGLDKKTALKISGAFGGGMGHCDETCGAVTGAFMAIGLKYGKYEASDTQAKERTYALDKEFKKRFEAEFGSLRCTQLVNYNLSIPEELKKAGDSGVFKSVCPNLVKRAVEILEEIL